MPRSRKNPQKIENESAIVSEIVTESKKQATKKQLKGNITTGADLINLVIGGGYPFGIANVVGDSSSGKSFLSGEAIAAAYHTYGKNNFQWFYDDAEKGYKFNSKKLYGIDILNDGFMSQKRRSNTIEDFERNLEHVITKKDPAMPFIYVLDSFDGISSEGEIKYRKKKMKASEKEEEEEDDGKEKKEAGSYNLSKQKENHAIFRTRVRELEENNILLIVISQVKEKIGVMFGAKYYRTGGKSLDFYPNIIFWLAEVERYTKKDRPIGACIKIQGTKTRNDKPFRFCFVDMLFDYGVDNISSNLRFLYDLKTKLGKDTKKVKESSFDWDGASYSFDNLIAHIENENLENELLKRVKLKWDEIEESISNDHRKRKWSAK